MLKKCFYQFLTIGIILLANNLYSQEQYGAFNQNQFIKSHPVFTDLKYLPEITLSTTNTILKDIENPQDSAFRTKFYHLLGKLNLQKGKPILAIENFNISNDFYNPNFPASLFGYNYLEIGNSYLMLNNFEAAQKNINKSINISKKLNNKTLQTLGYLAKSQLLLLNDSLNNNSKYLDSAIYASNNLDNQKLNYLIKYYHAELYLQKSDTTKALKWFRNALLQLDLVKDSSFNYLEENSNIYTNISICLHGLKQTDQLKKAIKKAIEYNAQAEASINTATNYLELSKLLFQTNEIGTSEELSATGYQLCLDYNFDLIRLQLLELRANIFETKGDFLKAKQCLVKADYLSNKILSNAQVKRNKVNQEQSAKANEFLLSDQIDKQASMIQENIQYKTQSIIIVVTCILLCIALLMVVIKLKNYKKQSAEKINQANSKVEILQKQEIEIKEAAKQMKLKLEEKINELENITDEKSHLLSIVSHDLRTPLNSIIGLAELIEIEEIKVSKSTKEYLQLIIESGNRMQNMISTLLDIRKIETKNIEVNFTDVNVFQTIQKITTDFKPWINRKGISINIENIDVVQTVYADPTLFQQSVENLISNAIKFSPFNANVVIQGSLERSKFQVRVIDQGPGLSKDDQKLLFTKYKRLSARPTAGEDSIGIGLSLVKKLVELMQGRVFYRTELGKGSTFGIEIKTAKS